MMKIKVDILGIFMIVGMLATGIAVVIAFMHAIGLWPEKWRF